MASQDARLSKFESNFKQQHSEMTNKIDTVLKAITNRITGTLPSHMVKNPKLSTSLVLSACSYPAIDPQWSSYPSTSINAIKTCSTKANISQTSQPQRGMGIGMQPPEEQNQLFEVKFLRICISSQPVRRFVQGEVSTKIEDSGLFTLPCQLGDSKPFNILADLGSCVNIIPLYLFKKLNIGLLEETNHIFGLADGTKSYPVGIVKDVELHIVNLKLLNDFYIIGMKKDPETPLLVGRGFLATANAVIDCRMAKIAVGEGITRSVFGVKGVDLGAQTPYYARKDFLDCHLPGEWEIARDAEINPFKDVLVFRRMVEFLRAIPINLKSFYAVLSSDLTNKIAYKKFLIKNGEEIFTDAGDGVMIYPDGVASPA
ncbi:MAK10-like protein, partial [Tanacetum coccineum]